MRKFYLAIASCVALVAFMGFSASALAAPQVDPNCDAVGNPTEILDFEIDTPDSRWARDVSSLDGAAYACGSGIDDGFVGADTLYNHADIYVPSGVNIADSDLVPVGSRAASAVVNILYHDPFSLAHFDSDVVSDVATDSKSECQGELDNEIVGPTPGNEPGSEIITCLKGTNDLGQNWSWAVRTADGKMWLTVGPMHAAFGIEPGLTRLNLVLCANYGAVGSTECGSEGDQFQQRNGSGCWNKKTYSARGVMENGTVTPWANTKVRWRDNYKPFPQIREYCPPRSPIDRVR